MSYSTTTIQREYNKAKRVYVKSLNLYIAVLNGQGDSQGWHHRRLLALDDALLQKREFRRWVRLKRENTC